MNELDFERDPGAAPDWEVTQARASRVRYQVLAFDKNARTTVFDSR